MVESQLFETVMDRPETATAERANARRDRGSIVVEQENEVRRGCVWGGDIRFCFATNLYTITKVGIPKEIILPSKAQSVERDCRTCEEYASVLYLRNMEGNRPNGYTQAIRLLCLETALSKDQTYATALGWRCFLESFPRCCWGIAIEWSESARVRAEVHHWSMCRFERSRTIRIKSSFASLLRACRVSSFP